MAEIPAASGSQAEAAPAAARTTLTCLYVEHLEGDGVRFFELVCGQDLEGVICKPKTSPYPFTWIKVKNPNYSQAVRRKEMFDRLLPPR